ncbi:MAG: protoheme IX farnesyltransferase [Planctomycetes bacterium]|nr:protoheme IX farnesyltransferase [Planctomycetota bacterium]
MTPPTFTDAAIVAPPFAAGAAESAPPTAHAASWAADVSRLTRPRIAVMVLATVVTALWLTGGRPENPAAVAVLLLGTALVAASSSIANQILERDTDRLMSRTADRPLASGRLGVRDAWWLTASTLIVGMACVWASCGWQPTAAAVATWLLYVLLYTPLKQTTPLNTAVGAVAGALPVAIGWLAAGGPERLAAGDARGGLAAAALATVLYLWQFPHFMAIAWLYRRQYEAAGLKMLTVVDPSGLRAAGQSLAAALAMVPASLVLAVPSGSVRLFLAAAVASIAYVVASIRFAVRRDDASARILLFTSLGSLLGLLTAAVAFGRPV